MTRLHADISVFTPQAKNSKVKSANYWQLLTWKNHLKKHSRGKIKNVFCYTNKFFA